ncbi:hypothetical protein BHM03_00034311 [Ensete ventricosum]|nr:hypothetical protein BHM03_00034311 [Ensete ventricosum]
MSNTTMAPGSTTTKIELGNLGSDCTIAWNRQYYRCLAVLPRAADARGDRLRSRPPAGGSRLQRVAGLPARVGCSTTPTGTAASRQGGWAACGSAARGSPRPQARATAGG